MKRLFLVFVGALLLSGCAASEDSSTKGEIINLYFVADTPRGFKLFGEYREFPESENLNQDVISALVTGEVTPQDPDYVNLWGPGNSVNSISSSDSNATIDFGSIKLNVGSESEQRAIDQLVWTFLELNPTTKALRFTLNGEIVESFAGHVDTTGEFTRAPAYEVLNPLQITSIAEGATLDGQFQVSGEACTFEANVVWKLFKDGKSVSEGFTTAQTACPDRSKWSVSLDELEPGAYTFEVVEYSAEDGSLFAIDNKNFIVK